MQTEVMKTNVTSPAEYFGSLIRRPRQGSFKVYVGSVPPGHLFETIVREGKQLISSKLDVVVALDEKSNIVEFPQSNVIAAKEVLFKEMKYKEIDYDEIQRRSPDVVIIDDLLHVNLIGQQAETRYKSVKTILSMGISVVSSVYSPWDTNLKTVLGFLGSGVSVPVEKWAELPKDEIVALVFTPKETFSHAELLSCN
jgi:hypothetical protein